MRDSVFERVSFKGADMRSVFLDNTFFFSCDFQGAHIYLEDFENAALEEASLENAIMLP